MNAAQFKYEFRLVADFLFSMAAPGFTAIEISTFLTKAQEEIVKTRYVALGNKYRQGFESSEKRREDLDELIKSVSIVNISDENSPHPNGKLYILPSNYMFTISEEVLISVNNVTCVNYDLLYNVTDDGYTLSIDVPTGVNPLDLKRVPIKPVTYDQYSMNIRNPFKRPYKENLGLVWRMDYSKDALNNYRHELITDGTFETYRYYFSYIKCPKAIIIPVDEVNEYNGYVIDNEGESQLVTSILTPAQQLIGQTSELSSELHREIIQLAAKMAFSSIRDTAGVQIQTAATQQTE